MKTQRSGAPSYNRQVCKGKSAGIYSVFTDKRVWLGTFLDFKEVLS